MKITITIFFIFFTIGTVHKKAPGQKDYDSFEISYFNGNVAATHKITFKNGVLSLSCEYAESDIVIETKEMKNLLIGLVENVYLDPSEPIITAKHRRPYLIATDYPVSLGIKVWNRGGLILENDTELYGEEYDIIYSSKFNKLYKTIENLTDIFDCNTLKRY